jgi:large conductance mechanosensitive channel
MLKGFRDFVLRGNVIDLAIAVVIGAAFGTVVNAFVRDLLTPLIAAIGGQPDFASLTFTFNNSRFLYGDFINALVSFAIVAAVVYYLVVVPIARASAKPSPVSRKCPECLMDVPMQARKCPHCTSAISPLAPVKSGT